MGEKQKVTIAGNMVRQLRESKEISRDAVLAKAEELDELKLSLSTLRRIEKDDRNMKWDISIANFLARELDVPSAFILPEEGFSSRHSIRLPRIETGARFKEILEDSQGFSLSLDGEPEEKSIRELFLKLDEFLEEHYGYGSHYYTVRGFGWPDYGLRKKEYDEQDKDILAIRREFELRDFIDGFRAAGYSIFASHFYRYEAYMDPDETGVTWMGIMTKKDLERLANPEKHLPPWVEYDPNDYRHHPVEHDGKSWRIILKVVIQKSEEPVCDWEVDADPGRLSHESEWQSATLRNFILKGGTVKMDHEEFLGKIRKEVNEFRDHTKKSKKEKKETTN